MTDTSTTNINLLTTESQVSPQFRGVIAQLQKAGTVALVVFVLAGIATFGANIWVNASYESAAQERSRLVSQVSSYGQTEGLLKSVRERAAIAGKLAVEGSKWEKVLTRINENIPAGLVGSISTDVKQRVTLTLKASSFPELFPVVISLANSVATRQWVSAEISSLSLDPEGVVTLVVALVPVL